MGIIKNMFLFAGVGGGIGLVVLEKFNRLKSQIEVIPAVRLSNFNLLTGVTVEIKLTIKNPTDTNLNIRTPFMRLMLGKDSLGSSDAESKIVNVPAHEHVTLDPIKIRVVPGSEIELIADFLAQLAGGETLNADLVSTSALTYKVIDFPFTTITPIPLKIS